MTKTLFIVWLFHIEYLVTIREYEDGDITVAADIKATPIKEWKGI